MRKRCLSKTVSINPRGQYFQVKCMQDCCPNDFFLVLVCGTILAFRSFCFLNISINHLVGHFNKQYTELLKDFLYSFEMLTMMCNSLHYLLIALTLPGNIQQNPMHIYTEVQSSMGLTPSKVFIELQPLWNRKWQQ